MLKKQQVKETWFDFSEIQDDFTYFESQVISQLEEQIMILICQFIEVEDISLSEVFFGAEIQNYTGKIHIYDLHDLQEKISDVISEIKKSVST